MKIFLIGLWLTLVSLGAAYGAAIMAASPHAEVHTEAALAHESTRIMTVPVIANGTLQGYVGMKFTYVIDAVMLKSLAVPPEVYLLDAAFNDVYMDKTTDFNHLDRIDLHAFTTKLVDTTNAHLGAPLIKEVLIESFNYTPKDAQNN